MAWKCKTPCDYIEKSLSAHPSLFEDAMMNSARIHASYANETFNESARQSALSMAEQCRAVAHLTRNVGVDETHTARFVAEMIIATGIGSWVQAFHNAAKLNCLPRYLANAIVADFPEGK